MRPVVSKSQGTKRTRFIVLGATLALALSATGCTGQIDGSFRFQQQEEAFSSQDYVNTRLDLLWIVDNSSSMDVSQQKLRNGFASFAQTYMRADWDIRVAVISTDTYMAHSAFTDYLNATIPNSAGYTSAYIGTRLGTFQNPTWNGTLVNLATGAMDSGIKYGELSPLWGADFARLLPGIHDGPITAFCFEPMPYFFSGAADCRVRDNGGNTGTAACINPGGGESSLSQCVNTVQNDTVRSGKAIIETLPPSGTPANQAWTDQLVEDFMVNVSTGSSGQGSERGLNSLIQLIRDNESSATPLFRENSLRGIIFVSDEDDQSMDIDSMKNQPFPGTELQPSFGYQCDQASLLTMNAAATITGNNGLCCTTPANNCSYGSLGTSCPSKTVDGYTYTPSLCVESSRALSISDVKTEVDEFFQTLDGNSSGDPNYFVVTITPKTSASIQALQTLRDTADAALGRPKTVEVDRGDRYIQFAQLVSNDALVLDIGSSDYTPVLDAIGQRILQEKSVFTLNRTVGKKEYMIVTIRHEDGSSTVVPAEAYEVSGRTLTFVDQSYVLNFAATDRISISYQPASVQDVNRGS